MCQHLCHFFRYLVTVFKKFYLKGNQKPEKPPPLRFSIVPAVAVHIYPSKYLSAAFQYRYNAAAVFLLFSLLLSFPITFPT